MFIFGMIRLLVLKVRWQLEASAALMLRLVRVCITDCMPLKLQLKIIVAATARFNSPHLHVHLTRDLWLLCLCPARLVRTRTVRLRLRLVDLIILKFRAPSRPNEMTLSTRLLINCGADENSIGGVKARLIRFRTTTDILSPLV